MKKPLIAIAVSTGIAITAVHAASLGRYHFHPKKYMSMTRSPDWGTHGNWGGPRNLHDEGVSVFANYTNNIAGNPLGGKSTGFTYCQVSEASRHKFSDLTPKLSLGCCLWSD
jgi:hypothetical protein